MPIRTLTERLQAGDVLLMDGATGDELRRRGADMSQGRTFEAPGPTSPDDYLAAAPDPAAMRQVHEEYLLRLGPWSAPVNLEAPEIVREVHADYLRLGADIIISNNFWTSQSKLAKIGLGDVWERYTRAGGELAVQTRDAINPEAYVAGGFAPPDTDLAGQSRQQARVLAEAGVDVILAEYLGAVDECVTAVEACAGAGLPVLLGVRHVSADGTMQYGESFAALARALEGAPVAAILLMCSLPAHVSASLPQLRAAYPGPIGAYAHVPKGDDYTEDAHGPTRYAEYGREWLAQGAQIIGGCCGTGPEHIGALAGVVKGEQMMAGHS